MNAKERQAITDLVKLEASKVRKFTITVYCSSVDADDLESDIREWFNDNDIGLFGLKVHNSPADVERDSTAAAAEDFFEEWG